MASPPSQKLASSKGVEDDFAGGMQFEDSFGTSWEHPAAVQKAAASGSAKAATPAAAADFSVPQLMDEPAASLFQAEPASQGLRNLPRTMRVRPAALLLLSFLHSVLHDVFWCAEPLRIAGRPARLEGGRAGYSAVWGADGRQKRQAQSPRRQRQSLPPQRIGPWG